MGRIASEANAFGKAERYADGGTVKWKIEVKVGVTNYEHVKKDDV